MNFSFNYWLKKIVGPLEALARANPEITEMAVGINVTSLADVQWLVNRIQGMIDDGDYACFDGTQGFDLRMKGELEVWLILARVAGYDDALVEMVRLLMTATIYTVMVMKNDLMLTTAWNPSGN